METHIPEDVCWQAIGVRPDLIVHWGDLYWRAVRSIMHRRQAWRPGNDAGPDGVNRVRHGVSHSCGARYGLSGRDLHGLHIMHVAPTILARFRMALSDGIQGSAVETR